MIDACLAAAEQVNQVGSAELRAVMRILLFVLAREMTEQLQ